MESTAQSLQWYAFRMSVRTPHEAQAIARREGFETYYALRKQLKDASYDTPTDEAFQDKPLLPSVIFVKCTEAFAQKMQDSKKMWAIPNARRKVALSHHAARHRRVQNSRGIGVPQLGSD